ncbi:hypothetical protein ACLOJK_012824 [Asimina triloba]
MPPHGFGQKRIKRNERMDIPEIGLRVLGIRNPNPLGGRRTESIAAGRGQKNGVDRRGEKDGRGFRVLRWVGTALVGFAGILGEARHRRGKVTENGNMLAPGKGRVVNKPS